MERSRTNQLLAKKKLKIASSLGLSRISPFVCDCWVEIVIAAALIYFGWNRPFKEWAAQGSAMATSRIHAPAWEDHSAASTPSAAKKTPR